MSTSIFELNPDTVAAWTEADVKATGGWKSP
jgi:hypothetical protein